MAKYGSSSVTINVDDSGGVARDLTNYITKMSALELEALLEESTAYGDAWIEFLAAGLRKMNPIQLEGFYDDTATSGPHVVLSDLPTGPASITKTITVVWGGAKSTAVEVLIAKYQRQAEPGKITRFQASLQPTGTVTEV